MASKKGNNLTWGITLLVFGLMFLIRTLHVIPSDIEQYIYDIKNYPLIIGLIFLLIHSNKTIGIVLLVVGVLFRLSDIILWTKHLSDFIWPLLLIVAGLVMVFRKK